MIKNRVVPVRWSTEHRALSYTKDYFKDSEQESSWIKLGHQPEALCVELHVIRDVYPWMNYVPQYFPDLENLSFCINRFPPGTYFPMHIDRYGYYSKANDIQDLSSIARYVIFLEDSIPGHILQVGDTVYHNWPAGLCVGWEYSTPHMVANLGMKDRYTLQITGTQK
jgi:hypothetical protein